MRPTIRPARVDTTAQARILVAMGMRHAAIAALALLCAASPAQALNTTGPNGPLSFQKQVSPNQIGFALEGVPDIDQARGTNPGGTKVGLPNNGSYYCVPTTGM